VEQLSSDPADAPAGPAPEPLTWTLEDGEGKVLATQEYPLAWAVDRILPMLILKAQQGMGRETAECSIVSRVLYLYRTKGRIEWDVVLQWEPPVTPTVTRWLVSRPSV
jgi:hypothetical protein